MQLNRREFLKISALMASITSLGGAPEPVEARNGIPYRVLGKTGEKVSLLCLGGNHIGVPTLTDEEAIRMMRTAADEGINFFDNAHIYHGGVSETRMGKALRDGYRDKVFLMSKVYTPDRDVEGARKQLESSLERLQTDVIDLWQVHNIHEATEPRAVYDSGLLDFMVKCREEGKIRYIGCTGHTRPEFNAEMIELGFAWDTCQFPVNAFDHHWVSFEQAVLPKALEKGIGVIGIKSMGGSLRQWPGELTAHAGVLTPEECMRYAMSLPISAQAVGMDSMEVLQKNLAFVRGFQPLTEEETTALLAKCTEPAQGGEYEPYKRKTLS